METQVKQYKLGGETMYTGTIQSQVSLQMLDLKWQKKKQDINSKKDTEGMTQDEILLDSLERQAQTERERSATSELYTKISVLSMQGKLRRWIWTVMQLADLP